MHKALQSFKKGAPIMTASLTKFVKGKPERLNKVTAADSYLYGREKIKELRGRYLERHFGRYGNETGLVLLGRPFKNCEEYAKESVRFRQNPKVEIMIYDWEEKKPSLGFFLKRMGRFVFEPLNLKEGKIKTFRTIKKKELSDSKVFNGLYRVC